MVKEGEKAPTFKLKGSDGKEHTLEELNKDTLVLYFYPKDRTPGCTIEAQEFTKLKKEFEKVNAKVVGVSADDLESHEKFINSCSLDILLLSDPKSEVIKKYGAYGDRGVFGKGTLRNTYIIKGGKVVKAFERVNAKGHAYEVLEFLKKES
ncbi:MAG: peroxiredoxin [Candidatus Micrarchaeaceae archaeon]